MRLPLEGLFLHLVRNGFLLSVRDYEDALTALRLGHGTLTRARLQWLCENLWAHTDEEKIRLAKLFRDFPQPTPEAIRTMTGAHDSAPGPGAIGETDAKHSHEQEVTQAPLIEFTTAEESGGIGLPQAAVPSTLLQPHILTPRPAVGFRQMIVAWRRFRLAHRTGPKVHLDIDATIAETCRHGTLTDLVLVPARRNEARMMVLFDASPSMAPWHATSETVAASLAQSQLGHAAIYYFDNDPREDLFESNQLTRSKPLELVTRQHPGCALIVIGDGGAGRGRTDRKRVHSTRQFVEMVRDASWWPIAWLNPMPRQRWAGSSAAQIAAIPGLAMFELNEDGLIAAVDHLRGKEGR